MKQTSKHFNIIVVCLLIIAAGLFNYLGSRESKNRESKVVVNRPKPAENKPVIFEPVLPAPVISGVLTVPNSKTVKVPVLMYHHVGYLSDPKEGIKYDQTLADLMLTPEDFEAQVKFFKSLGYTTVKLAEVYDAIKNGKELPPNPIVFTFDDGYKDVFEYAVPILKKYNYIGSFAIATELLGRPSYGVWDDVIKAKSDGMEIVSHTENHLDLSNPIYSDIDLRREIADSKQVLQSKLGESVDFFVYPYGRFNTHVINLVSEAGYKMAFTTAYGIDMGKDTLLTEPRVRVHGQGGLEKLKKIFEPVKRSDSALLSP